MNTTHDGGPVLEHLNDADLISYLDGELARAAQEQARAHLESCWTCRSRLNAVEASIDSFLRVRQSLLPGTLPPSASAVAQFRERLADHLAAPVRERLSFRLRLLSWRTLLFDFASTLWRYRKPALAAALAGVVLWVTLVDPFHWRAVSAEELLARAEVREQRDERPADKVVRSSVRIDRINLSTKAEKHLGRIDLARDNASRAVYLSAQPAAGKERGATLPDKDKLPEAIPFTSEFPDSLVRYFRAQGWFPEVSITGYRRLIAGRGDGQAFATRDGNRYAVHHAFAAGHASGISETKLWLSAENYSAQGISIFALEGGDRLEYRLTRLSLDFIPRSPELARLFEPTKTEDAGPPTSGLLTNPIKLAPDASAPTLNAPPRSLTYFNSQASDAEAAIAQALHRVGADLGEEINVFPMSDGSVLVQGLVDRASRKEAITRALSALPLTVQVQVYTPAEIKTGAELHDPPDRMPDRPPARALGGAPVVNLGDLSGGGLPLYDRLLAHFSKRATSPEETQRQIAAFTNEVVNLSRQAVFHAWALKKLDVQFSPQRASGLSASGRTQIEELRVAHRRVISNTARQLTTMLSALAPESASTSRAPDTGRDSERLFRLVTEQNDLIRSLFTATAQPAKPVEDLSRLLTVLKQLQE